MPSDRASRIRVEDYPKLLVDHKEELSRHLQVNLTTPISQAAAIVGTKDTTLRHWGTKIRLFSPERSSADKTSTQRQFNIQDIARLLIVKTLMEEKGSPKDVFKFMCEKSNAAFIDNLVNDIIPSRDYQKRSWAFTEHRDWAEEAAFWHMFVPRLLYLSMRLLFAQTPDNDTWLLLPLQQGNTQTANTRIEKIEHLQNLGEVLLGHCSNRHPFFTCITKKPVLDDAINLKRRKVKLLEWPFESSNSPERVYAVTEEKRQRKSRESTLRGAGRLLYQLQKTQDQWKPYLQDSKSAIAYYAPEFEKALPGDHILNKIAEQVIQLGGTGKTSQQSRWHFCSILLPRSEDVFRQHLKQHHLIVQGQSEESPYYLGKTELWPNENNISVKAYHSRHVIYRPNIVAEEPDIATHEKEEGIRSAIAVPIEGKEEGGWRTLHPLGVIYITSREVDAFSTEDDLLILRMMEKVIAEQVMAYLMRTLLVDNFTEMIDHPRIVDSKFKEFLPDNKFINQLEELLKQIPLGQNAGSSSESDTQPFHSLAFIAVDLSIPGSRTGSRLKERDIKNLTGILGKGIKQWARGKPGFPEVYYMHDDCYYLLLRDISPEQTAKNAFVLQAYLHSYIQRYAQRPILKSIQEAGFQLHLGVVGSTYDELQDLLAKISSPASIRVRITNLLNDALSESKDQASNIAIWKPQDEKFVGNMDELIGNKILQPHDEQVINQIADTMYNRVVGEVYERFKRENQQH